MYVLHSYRTICGTIKIKISSQASESHPQTGRSKNTIITLHLCKHDVIYIVWIYVCGCHNYMKLVNQQLSLVTVKFALQNTFIKLPYME